MSRAGCPSHNIGHRFGETGEGVLEGSILDPNYCIVKSNGECTRHKKPKKSVTLELSTLEQPGRCGYTIPASGGFRQCGGAAYVSLVQNKGRQNEITDLPMCNECLHKYFGMLLIYLK